MVKSVLTIDDAPSSLFMEKLDFLTSKNIPAIFFIKGDNVIPERFDWLVESIRRGYILGNHTHTHRHSSELSLEEMGQEIETCEEIIKAIYRSAGIRRKVKLFRFPYWDKGNPGDHYGQIQDLLKRKDFVNPLLKHIENYASEYDTYLTFNTKDWALGTGRIKGLNNLNDLKKRLGQQVIRDSLDVVVMHDHVHTHGLFPEIVTHLQSLGAEFYLPKFN